MPSPWLPILAEVGITGLHEWHPTAVIRIALNERMQKKKKKKT
jgi:hypothetical protein